VLDVVVVIVVKATSGFEVVVVGEGDLLLARLEELAEVVEVSFHGVVVGGGGFEETDLCCVFCERGLGVVDLGLEVDEEGMVGVAAGRAGWREGERVVLWLGRRQRQERQEEKKDGRCFRQRRGACRPWRR